MFWWWRPAEETLRQRNPSLSCRFLFFFVCSSHPPLQIIQPKSSVYFLSHIREASVLFSTIKKNNNLKAVPQFLMYLFVGQGPGLGLVGRGVAATQRRQVLHDGVQRLLLDCRAENKEKSHGEKITCRKILEKDSRDVWLSLKSRKGKEKVLNNAAGRVQELGGTPWVRV